MGRRHGFLLLTLLYSALLTALPVGVQAQQSFRDSYNATYITMNEGLAHNSVDDIYKDSQGFLWISMAGGGLARYDGYAFVNYTPYSATCPLRSNFVCCVVEDRFHRLWVGTEGGIDIIDLSTCRTLPLLSSHGAAKAMERVPATYVMCDATGCVWVNSGDKVWRVAFDSQGRIASLHHIDALPAMNRQVVMKDVEQNGRPWVGMGNNLVQLTVGANDKLQATPIASCLAFVPGTRLTDMVEKENEVWIGTNNGLVRYNRQKGVVKLYEHNAKDHTSLSQNLVTALAVTHEKQLIAATLRGINVYDPMGDCFERIGRGAKGSSPGLLNGNFVNCMYVDETHIWLGTESGGINKLTPKLLSTDIYRHDSDAPQSLSPNPVNAIYEDADGTLWVGTVEGGLNRMARGDSGFSHYTSEQGTLSHNSVSVIASDAEGRLWVGTWGGGVTLLDRHQPDRRLEVIPPVPKTPIDFVGAMAYDSINNGMWIGANEGIFYYDIAARRLHAPVEGRDVRGTIGSIVDGDGHLWMGCMEGVYVIDLHSVRKRGGNYTYQYRHLRHKLDNPASGVIEKITCFHQSADGTLWMGSNGFGIYKRTVDADGQEHFQAYTTANGLASNSVRGILEDNAGCLWISTNNGLSRMVASTECFVNYKQPDGLLDQQFYWNAACKSTDNRMYFGSMTGMIAVKGDLPTLPPARPRLRFTRLYVENEEVMPGGDIMATDISMTDEIRIHESDQSFTVEFSSLSFDNTDNTQYSYRLDGFDKKWHEVVAGHNSVTYTNLSPGRYTLRVRSATKEGGEGMGTAELRVVVKPYFYKTAWFMALVMALIVLAAWQAYQWRVRSLKRQSTLLTQMVEQRTHELNAQKQLLEQKTDELSRQNHKLVEQNEKITQQKAQLTKMTNKIRELTFDRIAFFTNITHEFRTPITLIIGPIERALKLSYNPQVIEQLHFVERNSKYLLSLVNQLMDFRKVESGKLQINKHPHNLVDFVNELITPFVVFARERSITIEHRIRLAEPCLAYDEDAMHKVLTNLLSNAIKFTPDGGRIRLYATLLGAATDTPRLYVCVSDTGDGVPPADIGKIFNRFFQSKGQKSYPMYGQSGSGIGLYLCRRIVQMHGGEIYARNNPGRGCSFRILLHMSPAEAQAEPARPGAKAMLPAQAEPAAEPKRSGMCVMVVEDNPDMRSFIRSILEEKYEVVEAADGMEALQRLEQQRVDFIVCDLMMPNMDGIELSRRVKANIATSYIPILMLTAKTSEESRIESYQVGVDGYLLKPFDEAMLLTRIANIMDNRKRNQRQFALTPDLQDLGIQPENGEQQFVNRVMEVMKANYKNPFFDVNDFCEAMGNSRTYINKKMRTLVGNSISQFIRLYRLNLARQLILAQEGSGKNVSDIAYKVGFNDPKYFSRCFQKEFNIKPHDMMVQVAQGNFAPVGDKADRSDTAADIDEDTEVIDEDTPANTDEATASATDIDEYTEVIDEATPANTAADISEDTASATDATDDDANDDTAM